MTTNNSNSVPFPLRWLNNLRNLSIQWKLTIAVTAVLIFAVGITIVAVTSAQPLIDQFSKTSEANLLVTRLDTGEIVARQMRSLATTLTNTVRGTALNNFVTAMVAQVDVTGALPQRAAAEQALTVLMTTSAQRIHSLRLVDINDKRLVVVTRAADGTFDATPVNRLGTEGETSHLKAIQSMPNGSVSVAVALPSRTSPLPTAMAEFGTPLYYQGKVFGSLLLEIPVDQLLGASLDLGPANTFNFNKMLITDRNQALGYSTPAEGDSPASTNWWGNPQFAPPTFDPTQLNQLNDGVTLTIGDRLYAAVPLTRFLDSRFRNVNWAIVVGKPIQDQVVDQANNLRGSIFLTLLLTLLVAPLVTFGVSRIFTRPLVELRKFAERVAQGEYSARLPILAEDEAGQVAQAMNAMSQRIDGLVGQLQSNIAERTRNLEIAAEISAEAVQLRDVNDLLSRTINLIRDRFSFYHAQVFLVDDAHEWAVLVASTGEAGASLLLRNHKLAVGSASIVGQTTLKGRAFITLDTERSEVPHRFNPILPATRSEMALPLIVADNVIGCLDVQSVKENAFNREDVRVFQLLADQLATAVQNARLFAESEVRIQQFNTLNRQLTERAWVDYTQLRSPESLSFHYDLMTIKPINDETAPITADRMEKSRVETQAYQLSIPIVVRGESIGEIVVQDQANESLSAEEQQIVAAVAERVAFAVENARLVESSQQSLAEVQRLYDATRVLGSVNTPEEVYPLLSSQIATYEFVDGVVLLLARPEPSHNAATLEATHVWLRNPPSASHALADQRRIASHRVPMKWRIPGVNTGVTLAFQTEADLQGYDELQRFFAETGMHMALINPLATQSRWFGVVLVLSKLARPFNTAFISFTAALTDQVAAALDNRYLYYIAENERQTLQSVLNSLPTGVVVVSQEGETLLSNAVGRELLGLDLGTPFKTINATTGETYSAETFPIQVALSTGSAVLGENITIMDETGRRADVIVNAAPIKDPNGRVVSAVAALQDITDLRELEAVLQDSLRETTTLYEASRAIAAEQTFDGVTRVLLNQLPSILEFSTIILILRGEETQIDQIFVGHLDGEEQVVSTLNPVEYSLPPKMLDEENAGLEQDLQLSTAPQFQRWSEQYNIRSLVSYPMKIRGQAIGWLAVGLADATTLRSEDRRFLSTVSDQTAIAVENIRLAVQTQKALEDTKLLYQSSLEINRAESIQEAIESVRDLLVPFDATQMDILLANTSGDDYRVDWVLHWNRLDPSTTATVELSTDRKFTDFEMLEAEDHFIESVTPDQAAQVVLGNFAAQISVPVLIKGRFSGRIILSFDRPRRFALIERQLVNTLVAQAAIVIDNITLVDQTQEALEETATLYQSSRSITDAENLNEVLEAILDHAAPSMASRALMFQLVGNTWTHPSASLDLVADWMPIHNRTMPAEVDAVDAAALVVGSRLSPSSFAPWSLLQSENLEWFDVAADFDENPAMREWFALYNIAACIVVPLRIATQPLGAILIGTSQPWQRNGREERIFSSLADQAAVSMQSRALFEQAQRRARQLQASAEVTQTASTILDLNILFDRTVTRIRDTFEYDHVQIFLVNENGDDALLVASTGEPGRQLLEIKHHLPVGSQSVIGRVTSQGIAENVTDTQAKGTVHRPNPYLPLTRSEAAIPLRARQRIVGALDVQSNRPNTFTEEDMLILGTLADQIAIAIDNAQLFQVSERRADEMRFLFEVSRAATTGMNEDQAESMTRIGQLVLNNLQATTAMMLLPESPTALQVFSVNENRNVTPLPEWIENSNSLIRLITSQATPTIIKDVVVMSRQALPGLANTLPDVGSAIFVPMLAGERLMGIIGATKTEKNGFGDQDLRLMETLGNSLSAIVQNSALLTEVQGANDRLRELDKLKSQFLANMSHELRTPLNSIIGFSRVILKGIDGPLTEMQSQDLGTIHESGKHLLGLVNDILDQAKIEAGKMELQPAWVSISDMINGVASTTSGLLKDKPVKLRQEVDSTLEKAWADEFRTRQVLLNLASNASKFTAQGSVTLSAFPVVEDGKPYIQISVTDTGIGIPADKIDTVFMAFQQVENSTARQYEGTGLGLPIAKSLVEMQGGRIWATSELNIGSTFSFTVPRFEYTASVTEPVAEPTPNAERQSTRHSMTPIGSTPSAAEQPKPPTRIILAIDDDLGMVNLYRRYLVKSGYEVINAPAEEAEELAINYQPRVILLDINMPNRSGWDVLQHLKDRDETFAIPVIVCTVEGDRERAFRLGADAYLMKSVDERTLIEAIKQVELMRDRRKVLIIDDQPDSIRLTREALALDERFVVYDAVNADQGLEMVRNHWPDVIMLDLRMPGMDGFEILEKLRADEAMAAIPVVMVTADDLSDAELMQLQGVAIYRKQELDPNDLIAYVVSQLAW